MGRHRKAWLPNTTGRLVQRGRTLPGYYVHWNDYGPDSRRVLHSKNFLTRGAARTYLRQHNARQDLNELGSVVAIPFPDAIREFLAGCTTLSHDTKVHYSSALGMLRVIIEDKCVHEITGSDIDRFVSWRLQISAESTAAKHIRSLRRFFNWGKARNYLDQNPLGQATALPADVTVREKPCLTDEDLARLVDNIDTPDRKLGVQLAITTGLDRGVIAGLLAQQIDIEHRCIRVQRPKTRRRNAKTLVIPLHPDIVPLLSDRIAHAQPGELLLRGLARQNRNKDWWHNAAAKAGLPDVRFVDLRCVASSRMQTVLSLVETQRVLGHSSPEITARHYTAVSPDVQQRLDVLPLPGAQKQPQEKKSKSSSSHDTD